MINFLIILFNISPGSALNVDTSTSSNMKDTHSIIMNEPDKVVCQMNQFPQISVTKKMVLNNENSPRPPKKKNST